MGSLWIIPQEHTQCPTDRPSEYLSRNQVFFSGTPCLHVSTKCLGVTKGGDERVGDERGFRD